jgi:hypothetical protein
LYTKCTRGKGRHAFDRLPPFPPPEDATDTIASRKFAII